MVLSVIGDADIDNAEEYVRVLPDILKNKTGKKLTEVEKILIFGKNHATDPATFRFTPGERILIRRISDYLKKNVLDRFASQIGRENYSTDKTVLTSLGTIFGKEGDLEPDITAETPNNAKVTLLQRAKEKMKEFDAAAPELTEEMVIADDSNSKIKGKVMCVYCNTYKSVSVKYSGTSYSWIMSNFTSHIQSCANQSKKENEAERENSLTVAEDDDIFEICVLKSVEEATESNSLSSELRKQMFIQNMKMQNSIFQNHETKKECEINFGVGDSGILAIIEICEIAPNGDCVFSAVTHQLYGDKIGCYEHKKKTHELRLKVIDHIRNNMPRYTHVLKGRVYEKYGKANQNEMNDKISQYLESLSLGGSWGGSESLMAISDMTLKNIIIFNEKFEANMVASFDPSKNETIMLAFRLKDNSSDNLSNTNRNHYDSVVGIRSDDILKETARCLIEKQLNSEKSEKETSPIVLD